MKKIRYIGINDFILDMKNIRQLVWVDNEALMVKYGFEMHIRRSLIGNTNATRKRYTYAGAIRFRWPYSGDMKWSTLPNKSKDSYTGLIDINEALIKTRLKQHFTDSDRVRLVYDMQVDV